MTRKESKTFIDFYPTSTALGILGISDRQLRRDVKVLNKVLRGYFGHKLWDKGFTDYQMDILKRYRELRGLGMRTKDAANHIRINGTEP